MEVKHCRLFVVCFIAKMCFGQNPDLSEPLFCQGDTSITYSCTVNPTQNPGVVTWRVNGITLPASYIEGTNTEVGRVVTDPARGLTANVTAYDGETLVISLTIDSSSMLIGTVVACENFGGNAASTTTDISPPNVQTISVTQSSLSTFNVNFALSNPAKQDCVQTYVVEDQESAICNATSSSTFVECSGPNLCTRDGYTLVGYASDGVSEGERSSPFTFTPDHSQYPNPNISGVSFEDGMGNAYVSLAWEVDNFESSIRPSSVFVGCTPAGGDGTIDEMINIEVSERERANQNYTFDTPTSLAELNGSSCCVRFVNGFCSSASCLEFGELPKMQYISDVTCERLQPPANGSVTFSDDSLKFGTVSTYNCSPGYRLVGGQNSSCQANGEWSGSAPSCECSVQLQFLSSVNKGTLMSVDCTQATYTVDSGYCPSTFVAEFECSNPECSDGQWIYPPTSACIAVGIAVGITFVLTFIFSLALGIIIGVISDRLCNKIRRKQPPDGDIELRDTLPAAAAIYEEPEVVKKEPEDIETSGNVAYGPVHTRR